MGKCLVPARFKVGFEAAAAASSQTKAGTALTNVEYILEVLQATYAGLGYTALERNNCFTGKHLMSKSTFATIQKQLGMAMKELCEKKCKDYRASLKRDNEKYAWVSDMGWSHRGFTASHGCYPIINGADEHHRHLGCLVMSKSR